MKNRAMKNIRTVLGEEKSFHDFSVEIPTGGEVPANSRTPRLKTGKYVLICGKRVTCHVGKLSICYC